MNWTQQVRTWHKWISVVVGIQLLAWTTGGLVFTLEPIEVIHGDMMRAPVTSPTSPPTDEFISLSAARATAGPVELASAELAWMRERWVWALHPINDGALLLVDARNNQRLESLSAEEAEAIARRHHAGPEEIIAVEHLDTAEGEYRKKIVPAWRVSFADSENSNFYIDANTGAITSVRTDTWRRFDFFWMLHIMDYDDRENFNHPLLTGAAVLGFSTAFTGIWLAVLVLRPRKRKDA
jgi:uncharacterized membrane protein YkoI